MNDVTAYFDAANPDTPAGMTAAVAIGAVTGVPSSGTGLTGAAYAPDMGIWNIDRAAEAAAGTPDATFEVSELFFGNNKSDTSVAEFLGDYGTITSGNGAVEMGPSALTFSGYIYIPPGVHQISIISDDGFDLNIGGVDFSEFANGRGTDETARVAEFDGGLYPVELLYFDGGGGMSLKMEIDGLPVDQSAFYQSVEDFTNPPADVPLVAVEDYHPSFFIPETVDGDNDVTATEARDVITGDAGDDTINGLGGDDELMGGFGDDVLNGGDGDDVLDGGYGSDVLDGGDGDDLLIAASDAGEQRIGQLAIGQPTRGDPDNEVDDDLQKLSAYAHEAIVGDDVLIGGAGSDTFLIKPQIDAKLDIIQEHVRADGTINWAGVAGENDELHDHWVDSFGIDIIADYNAQEDHIAVIGHTAVPYVTYADVMGDDALESIITVISVQHGNGGAHDRDLIGQVIVHGDLVDVEDIQTDDMVTYGVVEGYDEIATALAPPGEEKITVVDGEEIKGYDTREPMMMGNMGGEEHSGHGGPGTNMLGAITGNPAVGFDNANFTEDMLAAGAGEEEPMVETRAPFEQLETVEMAGETHTGTDGNDDMSQSDLPEPDGMPGALGFWTFDNAVDGSYADARDDGGADVKAYTLYENGAMLNTEASTGDLATGPDGTPNSALYFNGEDSFAFLEHESEMAFTQGTVAMWVRPDDLGEKSMFVTKDQSGSGEGSHFRLGHTKEGGLFLRAADPYKTNHAWETDQLLTEGEWAHIAVNFTEDGITVYLDGQPVPDNAWTAVEGGDATPGAQGENMLLQNEEPWVFGADQYKTELNDTAQEFATDDEDLRNEFEGAIADFGVWGGFTMDDVLTPDQINTLMTDGPGAALTNPSGAEAMVVIDDEMYGLGGNDTMDGEAGDDMLDGGAGDDSIQGGYGDDHVIGGDGNDTLDGGRGNDYLEGGAGDDVLYSRADTGEQRAGQLVLDDPSRPEGGSIDSEYLKLYDWIDQEIAGDDVLVGGDGADQFKFETLINGKKDILAEHTMDNRMIHWHGVAGENKYIHDHWVDGLGIDVIADFNKAEGDTISVIGHTTEVEVDYRTIDTNGDGADDDVVSVITVYSQQGNGGGAHDEDYLGYIVVHGDRVEEDDIETDAGAHYGIVGTIDDIQEAVAPNGETKWLDLDGDGVAEHLGYDTRDVDGDPVGTSPWEYSSNDWLNTGQVDLASSLPEGLEAPNVLLENAGGTFGGGNDPIEIPHTDAQAATEGTWAFTFNANNPGNGSNQALFSKDHSGYEDGGHLTAYITTNGALKVRFQGTEDEKYLVDWQTKVEADEDYHFAFTFDEDEIAFYLNGELIDSDDGYPAGMSGNTEDLVLGASTRTRNGDDDNLQWHFDGEIRDLVMLDRPLEDIEALFLAEAGGDVSALDSLYGEAAPDDGADDTPPADDDTPPADDDTPPADDDTPPADDDTPPADDDTPPSDDDTPPADDDTPPADDDTPPADDDTPPADDDGSPDMGEDEEETPDEADNDDDGGGSIFARIFDIFISIFSFLGGSDDADPNYTEEELEEDLNEIEDLLSQLIPVTQADDETTTTTTEEDEPEMEMMV
ncbi:MAG: LamG-like jellyroll fold domain-containing protein [Pseudomonadota bacterium]